MAPGLKHQKKIHINFIALINTIDNKQNHKFLISLDFESHHDYTIIYNK